TNYPVPRDPKMFGVPDHRDPIQWAGYQSHPCSSHRYIIRFCGHPDRASIRKMRWIARGVQVRVLSNHDSLMQLNNHSSQLDSSGLLTKIRYGEVVDRLSS